MAPALKFRADLDKRLAVASPTVEVAWVNQATWRHCRFGLKSAPNTAISGRER